MNANLCQCLASMAGFRDQIGHGHDGDGITRLQRMCFAKRYTVVTNGNIFGSRVYPPVLKKKDWIIIKNRRKEQALGICCAGGHDHLQAWNVGKPSLEVLRVGRTLTPATTHDEAQGQRHLMLRTKGVVPFCGIIDELIHGKQEKIQPLMAHHWTQATNCSTNADARHAIFRSGHVKNAICAELLLQAGGRAKNCLGIIYTQTVADDCRIMLHGDMQGFIDGLCGIHHAHNCGPKTVA
ncbi:hypothetical protein DFR38_11348 [Aquitalea magnusonii]|uniref:Uncharacterized protein n=1 Tax=Aquitalea magnusonii TaxID=332411 RepID=A0A318JKT0_9NEIS|nr:hypothetical protein DFR38_11348 [Aquitalea magnusonii]